MDVTDELGQLEEPPRSIWARVIANALSVDPDSADVAHLAEIVPASSTTDSGYDEIGGEPAYDPEPHEYEHDVDTADLYLGDDGGHDTEEGL